MPLRPVTQSASTVRKVEDLPSDGPAPATLGGRGPESYCLPHPGSFGLPDKIAGPPRRSLHNPICRPSPSCNANRRFVELEIYALESRLRASWMSFARIRFPLRSLARRARGAQPDQFLGLGVQCLGSRGRLRDRRKGLDDLRSAAAQVPQQRRKLFRDFRPVFDSSLSKIMQLTGSGRPQADDAHRDFGVPTVSMTPVAT
jgi:hypothetical protein